MHGDVGSPHQRFPRVEGGRGRGSREANPGETTLNHVTDLQEANDITLEVIGPAIGKLGVPEDRTSNPVDLPRSEEGMNRTTERSATSDGDHAMEGFITKTRVVMESPSRRELRVRICVQAYVATLVKVLH